ncbi:hypothetical protein [Billgrantia saliphila]|uniref:hypothetical protein n=1 Tax=Billgrantia saliphila TaxID=1848458 RepID=UPI0022AF558A|nr:hypothetical protein [Halomonas saliphila]
MHERLVRARATWRLDQVGGEEIRDGMLSAYRFADLDPYRAATHNKGIMNRVSAVVLASKPTSFARNGVFHALRRSRLESHSLSERCR